MLWQEWWVWLAAGVLLASAEIFLPGFVFLGFSAGAALTGVLLFAGGPLAAWMVGAVSSIALVFAVLSLIAWLVIRRIAGERAGQVKRIDHDVND